MTNDKIAEILKWWCIAMGGMLVGMSLINWLEIL
jgi:hypothetical protein